MIVTMGQPSSMLARLMGVITHVLACGLCSRNPHAGQNWLAVIVFFLVVGVVGIIAMNREADCKRAGLPPRQPPERREPGPHVVPDREDHAGVPRRGWAVTPGGPGPRSPGAALAGT